MSREGAKGQRKKRKSLKVLRWPPCVLSETVAIIAVKFFQNHLKSSVKIYVHLWLNLFFSTTQDTGTEITAFCFFLVQALKGRDTKGMGAAHP
jgi:uncharacterized membrane protein YoaT (DUF817 family)